MKRLSGPKFFILLLIVISGVIGGGISGCASSLSQTRPDFRETLEMHLEAISNRQLKTFERTISSSNVLQVIFPDGSVLPDTQAVIDFHAEWFKDAQWVFDAEIKKIIEGTDQSTALVKYTYRDNADAEPRWAWLVLVFQLENNQWRLIHDQNTRIENP